MMNLLPSSCSGNRAMVSCNGNMSTIHKVSGVHTYKVFCIWFTWAACDDRVCVPQTGTQHSQCLCLCTTYHSLIARWSFEFTAVCVYIFDLELDSMI